MINEARGYLTFEGEKADLEKIINEKKSDKEMIQLANSELAELTEKQKSALEKYQMLQRGEVNAPDRLSQQEIDNLPDPLMGIH